MMTEQANKQIYSMEANSEQEKQHKFNVMNRLGRSRALIELRRLEVLQIEQRTSIQIVAFLLATRSIARPTSQLIAETADRITRVN